VAFNLSGIQNSFKEFITGVGQELGLIPINPSQLYPENDPQLKAVQSQLNKTAWNKLPFPYTFSVVDITTGKLFDQFQEFALPISPNKLSQSEDPSTSIKITQGGTVTNHSGMTYKNLVVAGTTGISPFRGMAGVDLQTGKVIAKPDDLKFKSGHEVFTELRNWFRTYYQYKKTFKTEQSRNLRLVFKNFKDGEFLIVELIKFNLDRTAERSFLYDYEMNFKVIGYFSFKDPAKTDLEKFDDMLNRALQKIDTARGIFLASQELLRTVESSYNSTVIEPLRRISLAAKAFAGIGITAADCGNRIIKNTITAAGALDIMKTIKDQQDAAQTGSDASIPQSIQNANVPTDLRSAAGNQGADIVVGLNEAMLDISADELPEATNIAMVAETESASNLQRSFYSNAVTDLKRISANAEDKFNVGSSVYDDLFDRTATLEAESIKEITFEEYDLLNAFNEAITAINMLISTKDLFKSDFKSRTDSIQASFINPLGLEALPATLSILMPGETDLEQLSLEYLGTPDRWVEIAELNDLRSPYVVQDLSDTRTNIVRPGDAVLIPQNIVNGISEVPDSIQNRLTIGLNETEKSLGVDLKLTDDFDLIITNGGDLDMIAGIENMAQAVVLKLGYEQGELRNHPTLGVGIQVGGKFNSLEAIRDRLIESLTQDQRVENLSNVALLRDGSALYMSFEIKIKQVDKPIPLKVKL
tara:strand:+ start:36296 stop:38401 length:2106 start_codon:yes stop_codon:yes gene_type:complete